jgi:hypothetical protein
MDLSKLFILSGISDLGLCLARRTLLLRSTQRICHQGAGPREIAGSPRLVIPSDEPRLLSRSLFLRHCSDPPPSASDFATAIGVLPRWHRQHTDRRQRLAKQASTGGGVPEVYRDTPKNSASFNNMRFYWENGAPGEIRTPGLLVSAAGGLYPAEPLIDARILLSSSRPWPLLRNRSLRIASERVPNAS